MPTSAPSQPARALLVEIVSPGRFFAGWAFPFVKALLAQGGAAVRWVRFAVPADVRRAAGEPGVELPLPDRDVLVSLAGAQRTTHVLFSAAPTAALAAAVRAARPACRVAALEQAGAAGPGAGAAAERLVPTRAGVLAWAGAPPPEPDAPDDLPSVAAPDYGYEPANLAARDMDPFVFVCAGHSCTYRTPLATSAFFAERALPDTPERWGCAFCTVPLLDRPPRAGGARPDTDELLARQLTAVARTHPAVAGPLGLRIDGSNVVAHPARFAATVADLGLPPARLLVDYRADALVTLGAELDEAARRLAAAGHRIDVCLVGVESFSARQLDRYHKGFGPATNLRAIRVLRELEAAHPTAFAFRAYGGLSTILFDPWVTLADVALNVAVALRFRLEKLCAKLLTSRLRLVEGLPLTAAARAAGLLTAAYDDPLLDTARRNLYPDELPWRFADPRVEPVNRLLTRLPHDPQLAGDALYDRLQEWVRGEGGDVLGCAERVVRAAGDAPDGLPADALLARVAGDRTAPAPAPGAAATPGPGPAAGADADARFGAGFDALLDVSAFRAGLKPVLKLEEPFSTVHLAAIERLLRERWPALVIRRRQRRWGGGTVQEVFAGPAAALVDEAVRLSDLVEDETDRARRRAAFTRIGVLLGYPECCAATYAAEEPFFHENNEWLAVKRRLAAPGPVDPRFHPLRTGYVPCSLECAATREFVTRLEEVAAEVPSERAAWGDRPTLLFLDRPGDLVALDPLADAGPQFPYRVAAARTADPRLAHLHAGDTLTVEPGLLRVLRAGRETAWFALDAFLWQADRVQHADFWRECLREVEAPVAEPAAAPAAAPAADEEPADPEARLRAAIRAHTAELLRVLETSPKHVLRGWLTLEVKARPTGAGWGDLVVTLAKGEARLRLYVVPRGAAAHAFLQSPHFALSHDAATPIDTEEKERVVDVFSRALERWVPPRVPELDAG